MKALTIMQPWASLVLCGAKKYETRSWATSFRGRLAIHSSKTYPAWARETANDSPFKEQLESHGVVGELPLGCVIGIVDLVDVVTTESLVEMWKIKARGLPLSSEDQFERDFGDYGNGRFAWRMKVLDWFQYPLPARGALGLWNWMEW